jgi:quinol monooxygenase YgiN
MDVNNGYIYGVLEATATNDQLTNAWESDQALDDARKKAERQAFQELLAQFKTQWPAIVAQYHHPPAHVAP